MGRVRSSAKIVLAALTLAATLVAQEPVFKVDVRLVRLLATVKDNSGATVGALKKEDFTVLDNGVKQTISLFERHTSQPLSIGILVDISGSTGKEMKYQTDSVHRFLQALLKEGNPDDSASLVTFNWQVQELVPFTRNLRRFDAERESCAAKLDIPLRRHLSVVRADPESRRTPCSDRRDGRGRHSQQQELSRCAPRRSRCRRGSLRNSGDANH